MIHGIPGEDIQALGLDVADDLPVDISVNGACALQGFTFRAIEGPIKLPADTSDIEIRLACPGPCTDPAAVPSTSRNWAIMEAMAGFPPNSWPVAVTSPNAALALCKTALGRFTERQGEEPRR